MVVVPTASLVSSKTEFPEPPKAEVPVILVVVKGSTPSIPLMILFVP
jgi:hypothetical protein